MPLRTAFCAMCLVVAGALAAGGCVPGRTHRTVTFAVIGNALLADSVRDDRPADAALDATALARLRRTVDEINGSKIEFTVVLGNLLARGEPRSLDAARAALGELKKPYFVVLGPEGLDAAAATAVEGATAESGDAPASAASLGTSLLTWIFRDHGFNGPLPYWVAERDGGLVLIGLYTSSQGSARSGHLDAAQLAWLDRTLARYRDKAAVILSYHALVSLHPLDTGAPWQDRLVDNRAEAMEILGRHENVTAVISASHRFAAGKVVGRTVHFSVPGLSTWPLAYDVVSVRPNRIERQYIPVGTREESVKAFDRLAGDATVRALFGRSERDEDHIIQTFGGNKSAEWNLSALRP
ncbi:MAG: hypothetical protein GXY74_05800 [Phycisphaerae bacterium]|nr:hypothetical protein [Phycisphaerae bacterium]